MNKNVKKENRPFWPVFKTNKNKYKKIYNYAKL